jgi:hypothetical protein
LADPQIGDYWHEMFCPQLVVIGRKGDSVVVCDATKEVDSSHWTWDVERVTTLTLAEFKKRLCYSSEAMKNKTVANVNPRAHKWVRKACQEALFGDAA